MNNEILCSTGAYIGYENGYDPMLIPVYGKSIRCDAFEFMVVSTWNEKPAAIAGASLAAETCVSARSIPTNL